MSSGLLEDQKVLLLSKRVFFNSSKKEQRGIWSAKGREKGVFIEKEAFFWLDP